jgi:fatty acid kinase
MAANAHIVACDGHLLKQMTQAGLAWLETHQEVVNRLNVFPVPDGDTGTNMYLTMQKAFDAIADKDEANVGKVSSAIAQGALMGARGNSGVILSQWWRGFADALDGQATFDGPLFASACKKAVERAYQAVVQPVEGTILTVTRQSMEAVTERSHNENHLDLLFETKVQAAYDALKLTPELLPVLKAAGVVDSGGQGWTFIIEGMLRMMRGEELQIRPSNAVSIQEHDWKDALEPEDEEGYGYDVQFLMHGENMDVNGVRKAISDMGWSTLVVGDSRLIKVHVHVHDPSVPIGYAIQRGAALDDVVVENMQRQYESYVVERQAREALEDAPHPVEGVAVVAVAAGDGICRMFTRDLGAAYVIGGGQTMNPSTEDFLLAIKALPNDDIILLPNNPNIILAARQAASLAEGKQVRVVPSRSVPQGVAAMLEYDASSALADLTETMLNALNNVITGEVTTATRSVSLDGVTAHEGQYIGLIDDKLEAAGDDLTSVVKALLAKAGADKRELVTLYYGDTISQDDADALVAALSTQFSEMEFQTVNGGQPLYPYIISVE